MSTLNINIEIPNYPSKLMISKSRRPVFYVSEESTVRGRSNIPPSYLNEDKYYFDSAGVLINKKTNLPQLANPRSAGKPRYWVVNFQDIWNNAITKQNRAGKVNLLSNIIKPYIAEIEPITTFPIEISIVLYDTSMNTDISNKGVIYTKVIEDLLTRLNKIPDDSVEYVCCSGSTRYIKVEEESERKMVINIKSN